MITELPGSSASVLIMQADFPGVNVEMLFKHWTRPDLLTLWWPKQAELEPYVGGDYHFSYLPMDWHLRGRVVSFEEDEALALTWQWDHTPELTERALNLAFEATAEGACLTLKYGAYTASREDREDRQSHLDGWQYFLGELQKVLEGRRDS